MIQMKKVYLKNNELAPIVSCRSQPPPNRARYQCHSGSPAVSVELSCYFYPWNSILLLKPPFKWSFYRAYVKDMFEDILTHPEESPPIIIVWSSLVIDPCNRRAALRLPYLIHWLSWNFAMMSSWLPSSIPPIMKAAFLVDATVYWEIYLLNKCLKFKIQLL